jgi:hypothetical protein
MDQIALPKLIYAGDVPVESSHHGSMLLYRLLQNHSVANLQIIEGNLQLALERRLRGVQYQTLAVGHERLLLTRFRKFYSTILLSLAGRRAKEIDALDVALHEVRTPDTRRRVLTNARRLWQEQLSTEAMRATLRKAVSGFGETDMRIPVTPAT